VGQEPLLDGLVTSGDHKAAGDTKFVGLWSVLVFHPRTRPHRETFRVNICIRSRLASCRWDTKLLPFFVRSALDGTAGFVPWVALRALPPGTTFVREPTLERDGEANPPRSSRNSAPEIMHRYSATSTRAQWQPTRRPPSICSQRHWDGDCHS
jgi:hypothetical protein